jgi:hypothetical protein
MVEGLILCGGALLCVNGAYGVCDGSLLKVMRDIDTCLQRLVAVTGIVCVFGVTLRPSQISHPIRSILPSRQFGLRAFPRVLFRVFQQAASDNRP